MKYSKATTKHCFKRLETDAELLVRCAEAGGLRSGETADARAERCGVTRRIVEDCQ